MYEQRQLEKKKMTIDFHSLKYVWNILWCNHALK